MAAFGDFLLYTLLLSLWGVLMGALTTYKGLRSLHQFLAWMAGYVIWILVIGLGGAPWAFATGFFTSLFAGLWTGLIQARDVETYQENNPWYADDLASLDTPVKKHLIWFALVAGTIFGVIIGFAAQGLQALVG